jgi:hypothetical protein
MGPWTDTGAESGEQGDILWDSQTNHRTGGHEANSRVFRQDSEIECQDIMEEPSTARAKEETAHSLRARGGGALTTLGTFVSALGEEDDDGKPGQARNLLGNRSGREGLRRE